MASGSVEETLEKLEKAMMKGRGRWVADFNESFRDFRVGDVTFDVFISGNTREKGFLVSRLFSFFLNPNYEVGFFAIRTDRNNEPNSRRLKKWIFAVKSCMRKSEMRWAWLVMIGDTLNESVTKTLAEAADPSIGIGYLDVNGRQIVSSENFLGRQLKRYLKVW